MYIKSIRTVFYALKNQIGKKHPKFISQTELNKLRQGFVCVFLRARFLGKTYNLVFYASIFYAN